jgi:choline dehydrogenase-like flavoprotein
VLSPFIMDESAHLFDIVIVGGGTAGCLLASRLSTTTQLEILVLEAGDDHRNDAKVTTPLISRQMFGDHKYDWCYETTPQPGLGGRIIAQTRGRMVGGSSAINSHSLVYPNKAMHNAWAAAVDDEGWSWDQMKQYYQKFQSEQPSSETTGHEVKTPRIQSSYPAHLNLLQKAWEELFDELEFRSMEPGITGEAIGGITTTNAIDQRKGVRSFAGNTFLNTQTPNLTVQVNAVVQKIVFENASDHDNTKRAVGVLYTTKEESHFARARQEVILCAGTFGSPQILELSGIGDSSILHKAGVKCVIDLPAVGGMYTCNGRQYTLLIGTRKSSGSFQFRA